MRLTYPQAHDPTERFWDDFQSFAGAVWRLRRC